ncbi:MAG: NADPH-dependent 7-cyano-7-deazaguanine reductase QueF [Cellvibrionales bacterium]|nr:NADPH-dependent 7-cyano-7-deazaguanine reductase QueF [Cellvibrionales bacterium]
MNKNQPDKESRYPCEYDPCLLQKIARAPARETLGLSANPDFIGYDDWTLYELAWRDATGKPHMAIGHLQVPADSVFMVESKSLKLYVNSLFYCFFDSPDDLVRQLSEDLNQLLETKVRLELLPLVGRAQKRVEGQGDWIYIDEFDVSPAEGPDAGLLRRGDIGAKNTVPHRYATHCFRSRCPVTAQPDWASVYVRIDGGVPDARQLARYLWSFAEHRAFHENCVERIYRDIWQRLRPTGLSVAARFTRRGGIDINPVRASSATVLELPERDFRQ